MNQFTCKGVKQINNQISLNMTFTFTIRISQPFSSAREFQMGNFQKYWLQNVGQDFLVLDFFHGRKILKVDGRDPQNREKNAPAGRFTCMLIIFINLFLTCISEWIQYESYTMAAVGVVSLTISTFTIYTVIHNGLSAYIGL